MKDIWIVAGHTGNSMDESSFGLIAEAKRIICETAGEGTVTAVVMGTPEDDVPAAFTKSGADRIIHIKHDLFDRYHGEIFAMAFYETARGQNISCILFSQNDSSIDFASRLAAMMNTALVTRTMDFRLDEQGRWVAMRPVSNGFLFDEMIVNTDNPPVVVFLPSVLSAADGYSKSKDITIEEIIPEIDKTRLNIKTSNVIKADPGDQPLEDASIVVAGGRGTGKGDSFNILHELAREIGASVGGTRPVIDNRLLSFDRQIGQTGKTVAPDLIINCGISGANEYSAGMEKSKHVISINKDSRARIFRFSDLGVVGDVKDIVPLLIKRIKEVKEGSK